MVQDWAAGLTEALQPLTLTLCINETSMAQFSKHMSTLRKMQAETKTQCVITGSGTKTSSGAMS